MEVTFATAKLAKLCNSEKNLRKDLGPRMATVVGQRLLDLAAAETLEAMRFIPGKCHDLKGNFKHHLALHLVEPDRLVFRPTDDPLPLESGNLIWAKVRRIEIVGIGDYH